MSAVYCSGNHSPEQLMRWLEKEFEIDIDDFTIVPFGKKIEPARSNKYKKNIILLSYRDYLSNGKLLNDSKFKSKNFFVFAPPFRCAEIGNSSWLDFDNDKELLGISYILGNFRTDRFPIKPANVKPIFRVDDDYKTKVIDHIKKTGSILTPFMTLIYTLPNRANQKPVSYRLAKWMYNGEPKAHLNKIFDELRLDVPITVAKQNNFQSLLLGELGDKAREAFKMIREAKKANKALSYDDVSKKVDIQSYDLRYISKVVQSGDTYASQEGLSIKDFQKQQDAKKKKEQAALAKQEAKDLKAKLNADKVKLKVKASPIKKKSKTGVKATPIVKKKLKKKK